jgi:hypothetical protein
MYVEQQNDGVDRLVQQVFQTSMSMARHMGARSARKFMRRNYGNSRPRVKNVPPNNRSRLENRQHRRQAMRSMRGISRAGWWKDANPEKIAHASANLREHVGSSLLARFLYQRFRRQCERRWGVDPELVHQTYGQQAPQREEDHGDHGSERVRGADG